ncbi:MAG TPA: hypothetical protein VGH81_08060 [Rudaea sp.]|jgi:hypothetical protein
MHAYDFILILFSFVYAAAVTHVLSTAGEMIIASRRLRFSWLNAGWMSAALLFTCAWWIGLWDLHTMKTWDVGSIALYFSVAAGIYLQARLVSPRIPEKGEIDLQAFHAEEGRKYLVAYAVLSWVTVAINAAPGQVGGVSQWPAQNVVIVPMALATSVAAIVIKRAWVQSLALAIQIAGWLWYFARLQSALSD